jgi:radical SAM protein with 4Fe4S-binding SPASM domain
MANISITRRCRRNCGYCFAKHELARNKEPDMPPQIYEAALDFLRRSGFPQARLLGGEPTEHPRFRQYVDRAIEQGFSVIIFTGGLVPESVLEYMAALPENGFSIVLNTANPAHEPEALVSRQRDLCSTLGSKVILGVNIRFSNQDHSHVFDWVNEFGLRRTVRVGIAHPIWGGGNSFFRLGGPGMVPVFEQFWEQGNKLDIHVGFDCGFTPCMFSQEFVYANAGLFRQFRDDMDLRRHRSADPAGRAGSASVVHDEAVGMRCSPVIDILPDGNCIPCYALSRFSRTPLPSLGDRNEIVNFFDSELSLVLPAGAHRECTQCDYRQNEMCGGGCRARSAMRLRPDDSIYLDGAPGGKTGRI